MIRTSNVIHRPRLRTSSSTQSAFSGKCMRTYPRPCSLMNSSFCASRHTHVLAPARVSSLATLPDICRICSARSSHRRHFLDPCCAYRATVPVCMPIILAIGAIGFSSPAPCGSEHTLNAITWAPECGYDDTSDRALLLAPAHSWPCGPSVISCASRLISLSEVDPRLDIDSSDKMLPLRHPEHKADLGQLLPSLPSNSAGWYKSGCEPSATTATR